MCALRARSLQRGGSPSPFDRILATRFGVEAVELIARGEFGRMVCFVPAKLNPFHSMKLSEKHGWSIPKQHGPHRESCGMNFGDQA